MLPPPALRRLVLAPAVIVATLLTITGLPVLLLVAAAASAVLPGRWRPLRLLWMALLYLVLESVGLVMLFGLWVASGFGWRIRSPRFQHAHYAIVRWYLKVLFWECQRVLHVRVHVEGPPPTSYDGRPLLILSRHAGPGDSFLVVHAVVNWYGREPRIVLKDTLQWDPLIDVLLNRLPNRFIRPEPGRTADIVERQVGVEGEPAEHAVARDMVDDLLAVLLHAADEFRRVLGHRRGRGLRSLVEQVKDWLPAGLLLDTQGHTVELAGNLEGYAIDPSGARNYLLLDAAGSEWYRARIEARLSLDRRRWQRSADDLREHGCLS